MFSGLFLLYHFFIPEAVHSVVIDHPHGLHMGIADCRADEFEPPLRQILKNSFLFLSAFRYNNTP